MRKNLLTLLVILWMIAACNTSPAASGRNGAKFKTAAAYNDYIINRQQVIVVLIDQFANATSVSADSARAVLEKSGRVAGDYLADVTAMSDFNGDTAFRNAAVNTFTFYKHTFDNEYNTLLDVSAKGDKATAAEQRHAQDITKALSAEEAGINQRFATAQKNFAQKNKLDIQTPTAPLKPKDSAGAQD